MRAGARFTAMASSLVQVWVTYGSRSWISGRFPVVTKFIPSSAQAENCVRWRARVMQVAAAVWPPVHVPPTHCAPPPHCCAVWQLRFRGQPVPGDS